MKPHRRSPRLLFVVWVRGFDMPGNRAVGVRSCSSLGPWFLLGFFHSIFFPTIFALSVKHLGPYTKLGSSFSGHVNYWRKPSFRPLWATVFGLQQYSQCFSSATNLPLLRPLLLPLPAATNLSCLRANLNTLTAFNRKRRWNRQLTVPGLKPRLVR